MRFLSPVFRWVIMAAMSIPPLFAEVPLPFAGDFDDQAPWQLLGEPLTQALGALPSERIEISLSPDFYLRGDRIAIGAGTRIHPTAVIEGPVSIGADVTIKSGVYLRGGCWIGDGSLIGANTEVKRSIFLPGAKAPHLSYVGDSILGSGVNLGAGTILSNFRHDGGEVHLTDGDEAIVTARRKLGAILGDGVNTGCNCVLHPGCIVGAGTSIYPGVQLRPGVYPPQSIIKLRQEIEIVSRR
ncbi:MAG: UDP-N-acetylglucosamine diphosphorylase [Acidobacteria bacterium]|nr:UDP-N-acetylglucosamine diphosphorylase [Acidobacteriota bacterium]